MQMRNARTSSRERCNHQTSTIIHFAVILTILGLLPVAVCANTFYLDPVGGNINNDGSYDNPWSTLEEVINAGFIESYSYTPLPYDTSSQLALKNAGAPVKSGDTLILRDGLHGEVFLRGYFNSDFITVKAQEGHTPILKSIRVQAGRYWRFEDLEVSSEPYGEYSAYRCMFLESHGWHGPVSRIEVIGCHLYSTTAPWTTADDWNTKVSDGIFISGDSIDAINNIMENVNFGLTVAGDYCNAIGNQIINFSGDGMRLLGSHNLMEGNLVKNCYDVNDNHDDGIQSFTTGGNICDDNIVRGNTILNYEDPNQPLLGPLQGMGFFDGFFNRWIVENNLVRVDHWHGITFLGAHDCQIINNTVLDPTPDQTPGASWIMIDDHKNGEPSTGCIAKNNVTNRVLVDGEVSNNAEILTYAEYAAHFIDYANGDYHLRSSSTLIDAGDDSVAPSTDLDGLPRPIGAHVDIGCYEFDSGTTSVEHPVGVVCTLTPNPTSDILEISGAPSVSEIRLYSGNGVLLRTALSHSDVVYLNLTALPSGIYVVQAVFNNTVLETHQIVKH